MDLILLIKEILATTVLKCIKSVAAFSSPTIMNILPVSMGGYVMSTYLRWFFIHRLHWFASNRYDWRLLFVVNKFSPHLVTFRYEIGSWLQLCTLVNCFSVGVQPVLRFLIINIQKSYWKIYFRLGECLAVMFLKPSRFNLFMYFQAPLFGEAIGKYIFAICDDSCDT